MINGVRFWLIVKHHPLPENPTPYLTLMKLHFGTGPDMELATFFCAVDGVQNCRQFKLDNNCLILVGDICSELR